MEQSLGLRERKKQQTRERIASTALELFAAHGFDHVPVAEIARMADVSEATVFNYFRTKEALIYSRMEAFESSLLEAVRTRPAGESIVQAFGTLIVQPKGLLEHDAREAGDQLATVARIIAESPTLQARERHIFDEATQALASLLAEEAGAGKDDITSFVVANAMMGLHRALKDHVHRSVRRGLRGRRLREATIAQGERALAILEQGLASYPSSLD